jgi:hypothetical protein
MATEFFKIGKFLIIGKQYPTSSEYRKFCSIRNGIDVLGTENNLFLDFM